MKKFWKYLATDCFLCSGIIQLIIFFFLIFFNIYEAVTRVIASFFKHILLFFSRYINITSIVNFLNELQKFFKSSEFKYNEEVMKSVVSKTSEKEPIVYLSSFNKKTKNNTNGNVGGEITNLLSIAGYYPYNVCKKEKNESNEEYYKRVPRYRIEKLAEQLLESKEVMDNFSKLAKYKLASNFSKLKQLRQLRHHPIQRIILSALFNGDGESVYRFIETLTDPVVLEKAYNLMVQLDNARDDAKAQGLKKTPEMHATTVSCLEVIFSLMKEAVPIGVKCLRDFSDLAISCIQYKNRNGEVVPIQKQHWDNLIKKAEEILLSLSFVVDSFNNKFDEGRIYGEWFTQLDKVMKDISLLFENFSLYLDESSFVGIGGVMGQVLSKMHDMNSIFEDFDNMLPLVNGEKVSIHKAGGIMRLMRLLLDMLVRGMPSIVNHVGIVLRKNYLEYVAEHGDTLPMYSLANKEQMLHILDYFSSQKEDLLRQLDEMICFVEDCAGLFGELKEECKKSFGQRSANFFKSAIYRSVCFFFNVKREDIERIAEPVLNETIMKFSKDKLIYRLSLFEENVVAAKQELVEKRASLDRMLTEIVEWREDHLMAFLPSLKVVMDAFNSEIVAIANKVAETNNGFIREFQKNNVTNTQIDLTNKNFAVLVANFSKAISTPFKDLSYFDALPNSSQSKPYKEASSMAVA